MVVSCTCGKKYKVTDEHFKGRDRITIRCPNCGSSIEALREPPPPAPPPQSEETGLDRVPPEAENLAMPEGKRISLAILMGADAGRIFPVERPVVVIGRTEGDLVINDSEISRRHAQIEIKGNAVVLRDLKSTNGTYLNEQRVTCQPIENQSEFRVGSTTLMLILTDTEG